jgi:hypothetical protein
MKGKEKFPREIAAANAWLLLFILLVGRAIGSQVQDPFPVIAQLLIP